MDDDLSCTIYSALVGFLEHLGHSGWHSVGNKIASTKFLNVSPSKRVLKRTKLLGKRRREDEQQYLLSCEKRSNLAALNVVSRCGVDGEGNDAVNRTMTRCDEEWRHNDDNDPFFDPIQMSQVEAKQCLKSLCFLYRLDMLKEEEEDDDGCVFEYQTDKLLNFWNIQGMVDYEQFLYFVECCFVLSLFPKLHQCVFGQVLCVFLSNELAKLKECDKRSQKLTIFIDVYRIVVRMKMYKVPLKLQQIACGFLLSCFESVVKQPLIWHKFAIRFTLALNHCFFDRQSQHCHPHSYHHYYSSAINDICMYVLNKKDY